MTNETQNTELATVETPSKKRSRKTLITLIAVGAAAAITAVACGHRGHMSEKMMERIVLGHVDDLADEVDATDAQRAVFESTAQAILEDALVMKRDHKECKKEAMALLNTPTVDREAVKAHIQDKIDQMEAFALRSMDQVIDAYETLDDDQRQVVIDKLAKHMEKH